MSSTSEPTRILEVFYVYAHEDEELRDQLAKHLGVLKNGQITDWCDLNISAGKDREIEINTHLNTAHIILILISPDFISSEFYNTHGMERALERHKAGEARVIPVILRPVDWERSPFGRLQVLPQNGKPVTSWQNRDEAFLDIEKGIREVTEGVTRTLRLSPSSSPSESPKDPEPVKALPSEEWSIKGAKLIVGDEQIVLRPATFTIGRASDNQLQLKDPKVSTCHAKIHPKSGGYSIVDLGSTNGTWLNGKRLKEKEHYPLQIGDRIRMGDTMLAFASTEPITKPEVLIDPNASYVVRGLRESPTLPAPDVPPVYPPWVVSKYPPTRRNPGPGCRRQLTISISLSICLILLLTFTVYAYNKFFLEKPDKSQVLTTFCNALENKDYSTAYNQLSSRNKSEVTEIQFANFSRKHNANYGPINCIFTVNKDNNSTGEITLTYADGSIIHDKYTLINEDGDWKIDLENINLLKDIAFIHTPSTH